MLWIPCWNMEKLTPGRRPEVFGLLPEGKPPRWTLTKDSKNAPKIYMALKFIIKNYFRLRDVYAYRLGKSIATL